MTPSDDLRSRVLHAVRVLGYAPDARVSERAGVPTAVVGEILLDAQAFGHVTWSRFADDGGWSLTEAGRIEGERHLARELDGANARAFVESVMADFEPLNRRVAAACTRWQLTEMGMAEPPATVTEIVEELSDVADGWVELEEHLARRLPRFAGYHRRFSTAIARASTEPAWVTATDRESAHRVWFELHEDLLATLGRSR